MNQESDLFRNLSKTERSVLQQDQLERTYLNFTSNLISCSLEDQVKADCKYIRLENDVFFKKVSKNNSQMFFITPENYRLLGEALKKVPRRYWKMTTILPAEAIMRGYENYQKNPPKAKANQLPLEIQQRIIDFAIENMLWGYQRIVDALKNIGDHVTYSQVRTVLKNNHIPVSRERIKLGASWRHFLESIKINLSKGVIIK